MMKRTHLVDLALLFLIPLSLIGFSMASDLLKPNETHVAAEHNRLSQVADINYDQTALKASQLQKLDFRPSKVYRVKYVKANFRSKLDDDYRDEKVYRYVPGSKKNNRTYSWRQLKVAKGKRVYVDMKAKAYYRDDDGERESEDFYRIRTSKSTTSKFWVNEDVLDD